MKFAISRQWCAEKAEVEAGAEIGAGLVGLGPLLSGAAGPSAALYEPRAAFGRFVQLGRRKLKLSRAALADKAGIDLAELLNIEQDANYAPKPRTIHQLAAVFEVDQKKLLALSGLGPPEGAIRIEEAVQYGAYSESPEDLNEQEIATLAAMVSALRKP